MRLVSQHTKYAIQFRSKRATTDINGVETVTQDPIYLTFVQDDIFENEQRAAKEAFPFKGQFQHRDEATPVDALYRLSTFDTRKQGWDEKLRAEVEEFLRVKVLSTDAFIIIEGTPIPAPFPAYDDWVGTPEALVAKLLDDGHDLQQVLDYERLFGRNRVDLVETLQEALESDEVFVGA